MVFALSFSSQTAKVVVLNRIIAKLIDLFLVILVGVVIPRPFGPLTGFAYSLLADGMNIGPFHGQSIGKRILGLRVVQMNSQTPATFQDSVLRNAPVGVATFFAIIPVWGWLILFLMGVPLMVIEIYLMMTKPGGHRLGDLMGNTEVLGSKFHPQRLLRNFLNRWNN